MLNGLAHWLMARVYALAPVLALAPWEYAMPIWADRSGMWCSGRCRERRLWRGLR